MVRNRGDGIWLCWFSDKAQIRFWLLLIRRITWEGWPVAVQVWRAPSTEPLQEIDYFFGKSRLSAVQGRATLK
ncbi:hypothetical protein CA948_07580 [Alcaligenes aquatilis]|nr:hypothetical protein CA948_07580 [Alcaligenes aquatilis]